METWRRLYGTILGDHLAQLVYSTLARQVRVCENTIRSWISTFCSLYFGFLVRPWHQNVAKGLRKEPKWYLRDWSGVEDQGRRFESMVACHLLKAVETWTDLGLGDFELRYVRDKQQREVDFLVLRDGKPWFLVEAKHQEKSLSAALDYFQRMIGCPHAFQAVLDSPFMGSDCFGGHEPVIVAARTLLSQLPRPNRGRLSTMHSLGLLSLHTYNSCAVDSGELARTCRDSS